MITAGRGGRGGRGRSGPGGCSQGRGYGHGYYPSQGYPQQCATETAHMAESFDSVEEVHKQQPPEEEPVCEVHWAEDHYGVFDQGYDEAYDVEAYGDY